MKYINTNPLEKLKSNEPYFFIRAQDKLSISVIEIYKQLCIASNSDATGLEDVITAFKNWQDANPTKLPD